MRAAPVREEGEVDKVDKQRTDSTVRKINIARLAVTVIFVTAALICIAVNAGRLDIYLPDGDSVHHYSPENGNVRITADPENERHMIVEPEGRYRGSESIVSSRENGGFKLVRVLPGGFMFDQLNGNFSGWKQLVLIIETYIFINTGLMLCSFAVRCRRDMFSYTTLFSGGAALLWLSVFLDLITHLIILGNSDAMFTMMYIYSLIKNAGTVFVMFSFPVMVIVVLSLIVSNISLIRHEGRSFVNLLGFVLSGLIVVGYGVSIWLDRNLSMGSEQEIRIYNTVTSLYNTVFVYFQAMLLSASLCGVIAVLKRPRYDKTHVIILGCAIADDGTPLPLLRGRIERAIGFAQAQKAAGGGEIVFVPSGGQGADEVMAEAESMRDYLLSRGVSGDRILLEDRSATTEENMRFSLEKIKAECSEPRIVFSTSGYHVLRSGLISRSEGLDADGIGSRTKWYFFPNAFVREFVGLLVSKWKQHLVRLVFFTLLFAGVNMIMPL